MKRFLFVLAFVVGGWSMEAQPYESIFGQNSTEWAFKWSSLTGTRVNDFCIQKDTIVHGISYKKLVMFCATPIDVGLLREDTTNGKVWYKGMHTQYFSNADTSERLAFDFTLQVGDTFDLSNNVIGMSANSYPSSWNIVDSIGHIAGRKHIYFRGACNWYNPPPYEPITFIEGIGCNVSPMFKHRGSSIYQAHYTLCTFKDGQQTFYTNRGYNGSCTLPTSVNAYPGYGDTVSIFPNPATDVVHVQLPADEQLVGLTLYDLHGRLALKQNGAIPSLNVRGLPPGNYSLKIVLKNGAPLHRRLTVH